MPQISRLAQIGPVIERRVLRQRDNRLETEKKDGDGRQAEKCPNSHAGALVCREIPNIGLRGHQLVSDDL
jgi:hypothetical protein